MYEEIIKLLSQNRLKEALVEMIVYASQTFDWQLKNEIEQLQTSYSLMLQYTAKGMKDPNKETLYNKLRQTAYELVDRIHITAESPKGHGLYYDVMRTQHLMPTHSFGELQLQLEGYTEDIGAAPLIYTDKAKRETEVEKIQKGHEKAIDELFEKIWVSVNWNDTEREEAHALLQSPLVQVNDLSIMVSAVTVSLLHVFDIRKFMFLIEAYNHSDAMVNQRALVGIAISCFYHDSRISLYPKATLRLNELNENPEFIYSLHNVQIQLLLSARETQKIDKKMREEIIPEMLKNPFIRNPHLGIEEMEETEDLNPEWEKWNDPDKWISPKLGDQLFELGELQFSGADIYMSTFSQLKNYPFFRKISHWFYPFDLQYLGIIDEPDIDTTNGMSTMSILTLLFKTETFCNSDKYSFYFSLKEMPEEHRKFIRTQISEQQEIGEGIKEQLKEMSQAPLRVKAELISRQYIQDLYRFFKLWRRRHETHDIFTDTLDLWCLKSLSTALHHKDYINKLADYLFVHDYLEEAKGLYNDSIQMYNPNNAELLQKVGYICQKTGDFENAIQFYLKADVLSPDNTWNNRHLALCYKKEKEYGKAVEYFKKVEQAQPDNLNIALQTGQCLIALEQYDEALAYFFKIEYLDKKPKNARRGIGWCYFITGKYQDAKKYYDLLLSEHNPIIEDWINAGHVYYMLGEISQALEYYHKAQALCDSHSEFARLYLNDKKELMKQGMKETDLYILLDELV